MTSVSIAVPERVARRIREEARRLGMSSDEYLIELVTQGLDPRDRAREYVGSARELIEQALKELRGGNVRQAAEKVWGAAALSIKAYAWWVDGRRLASHGELWEYKRVLEDGLGDWVSDAWAQAIAMHTCFYEGWCAGRDVERALERVRRLVDEVASKIGGKED